MESSIELASLSTFCEIGLTTPLLPYVFFTKYKRMQCLVTNTLIPRYTAILFYFVLFLSLIHLFEFFW